MIFQASLLSFFCWITILPFLTRATIPFGHLGLENIGLFLNEFHFLSGNNHADISANHWCAIISDDFLRCVVYNTATTPTRLAGIEYIVSPTTFESLDYEER